MNKLWQFLFGHCGHKRITFPLSPAPKSTEQRRTYVVCLTCGREFHYDWNRMRVDKAPINPALEAEDDLEYARRLA